MMQIDSAILATDKVICKNISRFDDSERGLLSQNILSQLRNFVEYIADKVYANGSDLDPNNYALNVEALKYLQTRGDLRFLHQFHELLQKSVSHYTLDENGSERLMLKYYEYLLKIKIFLNDTYGLHVLDNIEDFPLDTDTELSEYHEKIAEKIYSPSPGFSTSTYSDRYYIQKIKPFFVNQRIYYEVTFTAANSKMSKFDRVIAFSRYEILSNYAVKLSIRNDSINVLGKDMTIQIIDGWNVSIRPCELDNFADIIGKHSKINTGTKEYSELMRFLTETKMPLSELVACSERYYGFVKNQITSQAKLMTFHDFVYIKGYADDSAFIIQKLRDLATSGIAQYTGSVDSWLNKGSYSIDSPEKKDALRNMFAKSQVALIYGSAGTGKSTLINHISNFFSNQKKLYLANTHPAVDNMRRKVTASNREFNTIASFISEKNQHTECDVLIIDECSTVSNSDMRKVLEKAEFKLLVLVGDVYQIESIYFGNWFDIARNFISQDSIFELTHPYRTQNENLLTVWERVRNLDIAILEPLVKSEYSIRLDESIFSHAEEDEIILCLNYDGLYGINNINRFLQNSNPSPAIQWGIGLYKVGDPVLFNESDRFSPLIHNNSKGRIVGIATEEMKIWFEIELDCVINELDAWGYDFELMDASKSGNSIIKFSVDKYRSTDEDDDYSDTVVPFQVAYAVSIHKAQGLEYRSVKIVITTETEERITHNIFYTAITRAKENLRIYWSPETEKSVLENLTVRDSRRDANLLKQLYSL